MTALWLALVLVLDGPSLERDLDRIVHAHLAQTGVPGVVVSVTEGDDVLVLKGWGVADVASGRPMDPRTTTVRIASLSKTFTATAVAQLQDAGELDVDAPVDTYLKGVRTGTAVTTRHLLAHTSGYINFNTGRVSLQPPGELQAFVAATMPPHMRPPGTATLYTNHGNALAGLVVQDVAGMPFTVYVKERIFDPLGMASTSYDPDDTLATSYQVEDGEPRPWPYEYFRTVPASAVHSTAQDMAAYLIAHAGSGAPILSAAAIERMRTPQPTIHPALPEYHYAFAPTLVQGRPARAHGGSVPAFLSRMVVFDEHRVGVFVAQNAFGPNVSDAVIDAVAASLPTPETEMEVEGGRAVDPDGLVGDYRVLDKHDTAAFTRPVAVLAQDPLLVRLDAEGFIVVDGRRYGHAGDDVYRAGERTLVFVRDDGGRAQWVHRDRASAYRPPWHGDRAVQVGLYLLALGLVALGMRRRVFVGLGAAILAGAIVPQVAAAVADAGQPVYTHPFRLGLPWWVAACLWLPRLGAAAAVVLVLLRREATGGLVAAGGVLLVLLELYWRTPPPGLTTL